MIWCVEKRNAPYLCLWELIHRAPQPRSEMLFFVTGGNGAGKTACIPPLTRLLPEFAIHDFADLGLPEKPNAIWRQETTELWIRTYIEKYQPRGQHTVICGEAVFGEIYAAPSIEHVDAWHSCLLDCDDVSRVERLRMRGGEAPNMHLLCWAAWLRVHAVDPTWAPEVIQDKSQPSMRWERWAKYRRGDPAWRQEIINTTTLSVEDTALAIQTWIVRCLIGP
jgi:hypothetical protein